MLSLINSFHRKGSLYILDKPQVSPSPENNDVEKYLEKVLQDSSDLSSYSEELDAHIHDWSTEYHLSGQRANLLRGFDFSQITNVLELGCECGSITRLLGERGLSVDAVEVDPAKSALAAARCRDLDQVRIYNAAFNDLEWPNEAYDAVVLVGVFARAIELVQDAKDSAEAVEKIMTAANRAVKGDGVIIIAAENRLGMKYVIGANEEHRSRQYIGIHSYFGEKNINTFSYDEWSELMRRFEFREVVTYLPFPDFKVPSVILSGEYVSKNPYAFCHLEGLPSRDYILPTKFGVTEPMFWQAANTARTMLQHSNSFLFICSPRGTAARLGSYDFLHLPNFLRKTAFCVITKKTKDQDLVSRERLVDVRPESGRFRQQLLTEKYHRGLLLSAEWIRALLIEPDGDRFVELVRKYVEYLHTVPVLSMDLLPKNIVVGADGTYHSFDQEWLTDHEITPSLLVFRALLSLPMISVAMLRPYFTVRQLGSVKEFVIYVGNRVGFDLDPVLTEFTELEEEFQTSVSRFDQSRSIFRLLETQIVSAETENAITRARIYWKCEGEGYDSRNMKTFFFDVSGEAQTIRVKLPPRVARATCLRFDPCDETRQSGVGFMRFNAISISLVGSPQKNADSKILWRLDGQDEIAQNANMSGVIYKKTEHGAMYAVTGDDPQFEFEFTRRLSPTENQYVEITLSVSMPVSPDYLLAKDTFLLSEKKFNRKLVSLTDARGRISELEGELSTIKQSRVWRAITAYRRVLDNGILPGVEAFKDRLKRMADTPGL